MLYIPEAACITLGADQAVLMRAIGAQPGEPVPQQIARLVGQRNLAGFDVRVLHDIHFGPVAFLATLAGGEIIVSFASHALLENRETACEELLVDADLAVRRYGRKKRPELFIQKYLLPFVFSTRKAAEFAGFHEKRFGKTQPVFCKQVKQFAWKEVATTASQHWVWFVLAMQSASPRVRWDRYLEGPEFASGVLRSWACLHDGVPLVAVIVRTVRNGPAEFEAVHVDLSELKCAARTQNVLADVLQSFNAQAERVHGSAFSALRVLHAVPTELATAALHGLGFDRAAGDPCYDTFAEFRLALPGKFSE